MRRSVLTHHLLTLEPVEYAHLRSSAPALAFTLASAATAAIPGNHPDQGGACREWLDTLMPGDREPGWLTRLAGLLLAARDLDSPLIVLMPELEDVRLLQAAYMLAVDLTTRTARPGGPTLTVLQRQGLTTRTTPRAALTEIVSRLQAKDPGFTPPASIRAALTRTRTAAPNANHPIHPISRAGRPPYTPTANFPTH